VNIYFVNGIESDTYITPGIAIVSAESEGQVVALLNDTLYADSEDVLGERIFLDQDTLEIERLGVAIADGPAGVIRIILAHD
jgi:hypothetical protein